ncbi:NAD(P)/FAD-dependent oxidoreductase [Maritimibacter sp. DP1N21-5]|uniref:NAD(P)/FAD-dependent oxidoreductase n=1 Tax=Maritimibacter sp. DP1N21-5 TaxID=2836867 RepID=UPI001C47F39D|nr:FAD-dependent oxidoreductase [Maritimibacter sp. DP1N21-5]MBV7408404.1 FAD-dependent oxidoreductase [Maritimibacter sp. DP1N21-5]
MAGCIVVGAGQAGSALVAKLRHGGYEGPITLIGEEPVPPYQRPPLSKAYLLGDMTLDRLYLRPESFYTEKDIALRLNTVVEGIDPAAKTLRLADGEVLEYEHLALTTGSIPNRLPAAIGGDLAGVYTVRTLADVDAMAHEFAEGRRVLVVGGGYIGLEAAAVASKKGMKVTLIEMGQRILQRVAAPETSEYFRELHRNHGATILEEVGLSRLTGDGHVSGAELTDGSTLDVDFVIVGVGIRPDTRLAEAAGLTIDNGIATDAQGHTSDPSIYAAGDCASFPYKGGRVRLESVGNAIDQAELVAENIMGAGKDYVAKPWFWSDQYDTKLQIAGLNTGYDRVVTRTSEGGRSFWYYAGDTLVAVDAMDDPRAYMVGKRLIEGGKSPAPAAVADTATDLKELLKA